MMTSNKFESYYFKESINDKSLFKVIFLAGGPGSGKSFISKLAFAGEPVVYINSDNFTEILLNKEDLPFIFNKEDEETYNKQQLVRKKAKNLITKRFIQHVNGMLSLVIDGTGRDYDKIFKLREVLKEIGYDSYMIFVNTSLNVAKERNEKRERKIDNNDLVSFWNKIQENIGRFQSLFGTENFIVVDNNKPLDVNEIKILELKLTRMIRKFLNEPLKNIVGKNTLLKMKKMGAQYLSDLDSNIIKKNLERFAV